MSTDQIAAFAALLFAALAVFSNWCRRRQARARLNRGLHSYVSGSREAAPAAEELATAQ
jgi:hypothetical protein